MLQRAENTSPFSFTLLSLWKLQGILWTDIEGLQQKVLKRWYLHTGASVTSPESPCNTSAPGPEHGDCSQSIAEPQLSYSLPWEVMCPLHYFSFLKCKAESNSMAGHCEDQPLDTR